MSEFKYRPEIDGLRAVAVILVLLFHAHILFSGGFVGVDVFFVISGYLITSLILKDLESEKFSLSSFWSRRIKRIIPAATVMTVLCLLAGFFLLLPMPYEMLAKSAIAQQLMMANIYFFERLDYFAGPAEKVPLLHTWSLAVEEQFYIFFPLLLYGLRAYSNKAKFFILTLISIVSFTYSNYILAHNTSSAFFLLPSRSWELLVGSLIALIPQAYSKNRIVSESLSWGGMLAILVSSYTYNSSTAFPGTSASIPCLGAALVIYFTSNQSNSLCRVLRVQSVVNVGLISYSLYLYHWPLFAFARYWFGLELSLSFSLSLLLLSFVLAMASYKFVEQPFRIGFKTYGIKKLTAAACASVACVLLLSFLIAFSDGVSNRIPPTAQNVLNTQGPIDPYSLESDAVSVDKDMLPSLGGNVDLTERPDFLLWGDSHSIHSASCFNQFAHDSSLRGVIAAKSGTPPILGVWRPFLKGSKDSRLEDLPQFNESVIRYIERKKIANVILLGRWEGYIEGSGAEWDKGTLISEVNVPEASLDAAKGAFRNGLTRTLEKLESLGANVWIVKQIPLQHFDPNPLIALSEILNTAFPTGISRAEHLEHQKAANAIIDEVSGRFPNVTVVDPSQTFFDSSGTSHLGDKKGTYYHDENHISEYGSLVHIRPLLEQSVKPILNEQPDGNHNRDKEILFDESFTKD